MFLYATDFECFLFLMAVKKMVWISWFHTSCTKNWPRIFLGRQQFQLLRSWANQSLEESPESGDQAAKFASTKIPKMFLCRLFLQEDFGSFFMIFGEKIGARYGSSMVMKFMVRACDWGRLD